MSRTIRRILASTAILATVLGTSVGVSSPANADIADCMLIVDTEGFVLSDLVIDSCILAGLAGTPAAIATCTSGLQLAGVPFNIARFACEVAAE